MAFINFFAVLFFSFELYAAEVEPLFVSLGSFCEPAQMLDASERRKAAYPFDWIISFDGEAVIELLRDDFQHFFSRDYFVPYGPAGHLLQSYYHLEFLHDGNFNGDQFGPNLEKLQIKYQRRIERFRQLANYPGKVYFIRAAYEFSDNDHHRYFKFKENNEITDEYAWRLYKALKDRFPILDFRLIIINPHNRWDIEQDKQLSENLFFFRANRGLETSVKVKNYKRFFSFLLEEL